MIHLYVESKNIKQTSQYKHKSKLTDVENKVVGTGGRGKREGQYRGRELRNMSY